jgi:hypothetical protein
MDDTAQHTGESDAFARLLAQLNAPTSDPVVAVPASLAALIVAPKPLTRAPELRGADELAAPPRPFPPLPVAVTPLVAPPAPPTAAGAAPAPAPVPPPDSVSAATSSPVADPIPPRTAPPSVVVAETALPPTAAPAPSDFSLLLTTTAPAAASTGASSRFGGGTAAGPDEPDIGRSTVGEKLTLLLAILVPPLGLLAAIVGAILSARRRGWVIGLLRAAIAIGVALSVVAAIGGYIGLTAWQQQQAHDRTAAASAVFCSTLQADPTMIQSPTFGWPAVAGTITDSLAAMQAYADKWTKLATASPDGIRPEVTEVGTAARQIIASVTVGRTVDDASNVSVMTATASASSVPAWYAEYCK